MQRLKGINQQGCRGPTADDIFSTLAGGQAFNKIDLSNAFNQLKVDESSSKYLTINTTKGLF